MRTFLLFTYHHHHLGYATAFISCDSVVVGSVCSLDVDLLLWAMYYRPIKGRCVKGHLHAVFSLLSTASSTSWTTLEVGECRWDLCVGSKLGVQVFCGLKYFGTQEGTLATSGAYTFGDKFLPLAALESEGTRDVPCLMYI